MLNLNGGGWDLYAEALSTGLRYSGPATVAPRTLSASSPAQQRPPVPQASCATEESASDAAPAEVDAGFARQLQRIYARLYRYQRELFQLAALQDSLVYLQTGGGKTWVAAALTCLHLAVHPHCRVFFVVRTVALAEQQAKLLQTLTATSVACLTGGKKEAQSAKVFCASSVRVAVLVDAVFFRWLSEAPEIVEAPLASLVLLDEAHHAAGGAYKNICEHLHDLRGGISTDTPDRQERLRTAGQRSIGATNLASRLKQAAAEERVLLATGSAVTASSSFSTDEKGSLLSVPIINKDAIGEGAASPVLEMLLRDYPRDLRTPQLVGLSASPVTQFENRERKLVELLVVLRCRLVGVVEEREDLERHLPNPSMLALSFLPLYEERLLQGALHKAMTNLFRRMQALIEPSSAQKFLNALCTTSVVSSGFASACDMFIADRVMSLKFKEHLRIPDRSALWSQVAAMRDARARTAMDHREGGARQQPITRVEEQNMCADFLLHSLRLLSCLSRSLIALENNSRERMLRTFLEEYSAEKLQRMGEQCDVITEVALKPVLRSVFFLVMCFRRHHPQPTDDADNKGGELSSRSEPPPPVTDGQGRQSDALTVARQHLPTALHRLSTRLQVLVRLFSELALIADAMARAPSTVAERHLRVLVFVETREMAVDLMAVLSDHCPWVAAVLQPRVLLGQKSASKSARNYMTRAEQTELLSKFRSGEVRLVFATTVAEEGIDVPACHVVLRCNAHTELRNIVQCCGRLRMKRTLFITLSNISNSHARLGYIVDVLRSFKQTLDALAKRCQASAWTLERDSISNRIDSAAEGEMGASPLLLLAPPNPNESNRLTTRESTLLARQREIVMGLQREHHAEVYCIQRRDIPLESPQHVKYTVMMSIPVPLQTPSSATTAAVPRASFLSGYPTQSSPAVRWEQLCGTCVGGEAAAHQKAFVSFCRQAQLGGFLTRAGHVIPAAERAAAETASLATATAQEAARSSRSPDTVATSFSSSPLMRDAALEQLGICVSYAQLISPSVVFLGDSLCLCRRTTWPPSVLEYFFPGRAQVMREFSAYLWSSAIQPPLLLRKELSDLSVGAPQFTQTNAGCKQQLHGGNGQGEAGFSDSVSEATSTASRFLPPSQTTFSPTTQADSRDWYRTQQSQRRHAELCRGGRDAAASASTTTMTVEFVIPFSVVQAANVSKMLRSPFSMHDSVAAEESTTNQRSSVSDASLGLPPSTSSTTTTSSSESGCVIVERDEMRYALDNNGKDKPMPMRRIQITYSGFNAAQVVSLEGLRQLGVSVVHGVDEMELVDRLSMCSQVGNLE